MPLVGVGSAHAPASLVISTILTGRAMADNLNKRPRKGILKNSSSFDTQETHSNAKKNKETKWDEMNIIATLHPPDKDYGHMKIDEPKTPFNYQETADLDELDAADLAERIRLGAEKLPKAMEDESDDESEEELTPEELEKRKEFEGKRKMHYNEFYAVKLARKLLEEEEDEDDDEEENDKIASASSVVVNEKDDVSMENRP